MVYVFWAALEVDACPRALDKDMNRLFGLSFRRVLCFVSGTDGVG